jgi:hypothetical protein
VECSVVPLVVPDLKFVKDNGKVVPELPFLTDHHTMESYWGNGGIYPSILDLGTRWKLVVSFKPRPLYHQKKSSCYPLDRRLSKPQSRSGHGGEEKNTQPLPGLKPSIIHPVVQC